jgi:hypothetical protein
VAGVGCVPVPATYCGGWGERSRTAAHSGEACHGVRDSGKAVTFRGLPTGGHRRTVPLRLLPRACAAIGCVSRRGGVCCGIGCVLTVRLRTPLPQGFAFVGDDALIVPPFGSHQHLCKSTAPAQRRCVGCVRLPPRFARRDTRGCGYRKSTGAQQCGVAIQTPHSRRTGCTCLPHHTAQCAVRCGFAKFWLPPADTYLPYIGRKPVTRQFCPNPDAQTRLLAAQQPA